MSFEELMADGAAALADVMKEPEDLEIIPAVGARRSVKGIVMRGTWTTNQGNGGKLLTFELRVIIQHALYPTVVVKSDKISLKLRIGDAANIERVVKEIISSDGGQWHLGL